MAKRTCSDGDHRPGGDYEINGIKKNFSILDFFLTMHMRV